MDAAACGVSRVFAYVWLTVSRFLSFTLTTTSSTTWGATESRSPGWSVGPSLSYALRAQDWIRRSSVWASYHVQASNVRWADGTGARAAPPLRHMRFDYASCWLLWLGPVPRTDRLCCYYL